MNPAENAEEANENQRVVHADENSFAHASDLFKMKILNENLKDLQRVNGRNFAILEFNNLTKTAMSENLKIAKGLLARVYTLLQEIKKNSNTFAQMAKLPTEIFNASTERIKKLEKRSFDEIKLLEIVLKASEQEVKIGEIQTEQKEHEELWNYVKNVCVSTRRVLTIVHSAIDSLEDQTETENQNQEMLEDEGEIIMVPSEEIARATEKDNERQETTEQLDKECDEAETNLKQAEIDSKKQTEKLNAEFELKRKIIKKMGDEIDHLNTQIAAIKQEFVSLSLIFEGNEEIDLAKKNIEKAIEQYQNKVNKLNAKAKALNVEYEDLEQKQKNMTLQIDNMKKEIQRLKASKDKKVTVLA